MRRTVRVLVAGVAACSIPALAAMPAATGAPAAEARLRPVLPSSPGLAARKTPDRFEPASASLDTVGRGPRTPVEIDGWNGVPNANPIVSPSDSAGAIGPSSVVAAANVRVGVYSKTGSQLVPPIRLKSLDDVVPSYGRSIPAGAADTDPKVLYDAYDDMFVLVALAYSSTGNWIIVTTMPGASAEDTDTWCTFVMNGDQTSGDGRQFADYPGLGFTADRVTITTNNFSFDLTRYDHAQIVSLRKAQLYGSGCGGPLALKTFGGHATSNPSGSKAFSIQPAMTVGGASPSTQYLASFQNAKRSDKVVVWRLKSGSGTLRLAKTALSIGKTQVPFYGLQKGSSTSSSTTWWDTGDERLTGAAYDADLGRLYTAHAVRHDFAPSGYVESAVRWYEIDPASSLGNSRLTRKGFVGQSGSDAAWPSVATDSSGVLYVNYSQASLANDQYLSTWVATVQPGSQSAASLLLKAGQARYDFGTSAPERWGDYSQINRDPSDGAQVALFNAYALDDGGLCDLGPSRSCLWQQWVGVVGDT
jgi:hypothetical protein